MAVGEGNWIPCDALDRSSEDAPEWLWLLSSLLLLVAAAVAAKSTMVNFRDGAVTVAVEEEWVCSVVVGDNRIVLDVLGCFIVEDLGWYRCFA